MKERIKKINLKKIGLILFSLVIVLSYFLAIFFYFNPREIQLEKETDVKKYLEKINDILIDGLMGDRVNKILKYDIDDFIMLGNDSYQNSKPNSKIIKEFKLDNYVKKQEELAEKLEKKIKNEFEVKIGKVKKEGSLFKVDISYKTFYYFNYISDLETVSNAILSYVNLSYSDNSDSPDIIVNKYKAKVKAMMILDKNINNYSSDESKNFELYLFSGKSSKSDDEIKYYLSQILGYSYEKLFTTYTTRISKYLEKFDEENLFDL